MNLSLRTGVLKSLAWGSVLLCWAGWVIALSGLSALQNDCGGANLPVRWGNIGELGPMRCDKLFAYQWWKIWYEWGVLLATCLALAMGRVHDFRVALAVLLGIATVLLMDATNTFYFAWYRLAHGTEMVRGKVYFSGTLITSIFNLLLIICLGTHDDTIDSRHDEAYGNGKHNLHGGHRAGEPHGAGAGAEDPAIATAV
ncbi:hypothetical protein COCSUDRAFT_40919 [Coccomyxa subellipsoidea C-169]|uniref:Uncharacterized protein n=1 Tax=Coccomyxa subellipsoidea (strain C-169) TaxID=574566 RepID=I0Z1N5_COCSC|nr:hypothetical protein COCSUDRAFT_40919 [Coccomyxa subellipsoidea C-169]EIE24554.1 hypothetical protein COCSUDRAFT_40919 [Coccomyxa subellipsoidea C-169]|eukprot:XP_005649098.1 hypothetical protein COCSUDRAFT_40919 [Coccomyxa subellipsoidea C-169]